MQWIAMLFHVVLSCENKWKLSLICLYSIQGFLVKWILSQKMVTMFWEYPHQGEASGRWVFSSKALVSKYIRGTRMLLDFLHIALAYLGFQNVIRSLMHTCCILMLQIISRQQFSVKSVSLFLAESRHLPHILLIYWDIRTLTYYPRLSQTSSSLSHLFARSQACISIIWFSPKPVWISVSPLGTCHLGMTFSIFLNCQCCLNFIDNGKYSLLLWTVVKKYPYTVTIKIVLIFENGWVPILVLNFNSRPSWGRWSQWQIFL